MPREPSAAEALYGHLKSQLPERPTQRPSSVSVADAMFPNLVPKPPPARLDAFGYQWILALANERRWR
jgi:hypothetical protein